MYEGFANVYDHVMNNVSYEEWFGRLKHYLEEHGIKEGTICELGCGTGIMTELFAGAGYRMIGVDRSGDMLALAQNKKEETGSDILYLQQEMEKLELDEPVDTIISVCDSVNYLLHEEDMISTFSRVKQYLKPNGYFIFDLKTSYCYRNIIGNQTWVEQDEEISYIWENYFYEDEDINEYILTIFKKQPESELYEKIEEAHYQKAYSPKRLAELLEKGGMEMVECLDENMKTEPVANSERIYVVAKVQEGSHGE